MAFILRALYVYTHAGVTRRSLRSVRARSLAHYRDKSSEVERERERERKRGGGNCVANRSKMSVIMFVSDVYKLRYARRARLRLVYGRLLRLQER